MNPARSYQFASNARISVPANEAWESVLVCLNSKTQTPRMCVANNRNWSFRSHIDCAAVAVVVVSTSRAYRRPSQRKMPSFTTLWFIRAKEGIHLYWTELEARWWRDLEERKERLLCTKKKESVQSSPRCELVDRTDLVTMKSLK
jgi:hypothetical protein